MCNQLKINGLDMKRIACLWGLLLICTVGWAQTTWYNPLSAGATGETFVRGQGWNEDGGNYVRLPQRAQDKVREPVWRLANQSAGLSVRFRTDAPTIWVQYTVTGAHAMPHMPATGVSGLDLYRVSDGAFCFGSYAFGDTVRYSYQADRPAQSAQPEEYELFLPLYNGVKQLEVGVEEGRQFAFVPVDRRPAIVVYGTSIAQGACASRPGMAWTNILQRSLQRPVVNLGFSGNGRLEPELLDFINELPAAAYVLDCMPNLIHNTEAEVTELVEKAVRQIRSKHDAPILLVEHAGNSNGATSQERYESYTKVNRGQQEAYRRLKQAGVKGLHYLSREELDFPADGWVDYVHPSDYGMVRQAEAVGRCLRGCVK